MDAPKMPKGNSDLGGKIATVCWIIGAVLYFGAQLYAQGKKSAGDTPADDAS